jgi:hypothetical protein
VDYEELLRIVQLAKAVSLEMLKSENIEGRHIMIWNGCKRGYMHGVVDGCDGENLNVTLFPCGGASYPVKDFAEFDVRMRFWVF